MRPIDELTMMIEPTTFYDQNVLRSKIRFLHVRARRAVDGGRVWFASWGGRGDTTGSAPGAYLVATLVSSLAQAWGVFLLL